MRTAFELKLELDSLFNKDLSRSERIEKMKPIVKGIEEIDMDYMGKCFMGIQDTSEYSQCGLLLKRIDEYTRQSRKKEFRK